MTWKISPTITPNKLTRLLLRRLAELVGCHLVVLRRQEIAGPMYIFMLVFRRSFRGCALANLKNSYEGID